MSEEAEYGSCGNIRWPSQENCTARDVDGNEILCRCGKPAGAVIMSKSAHFFWCNDCSPLLKEAASFVYKQPKN